MKKYIDVAKLIAEIERRIDSWSIRGENSPVGQGKDTCVSRVTELTDLLSFIDSLQAEQPVLPGIEDHGIPGKDFIPAEWVDACEMYGKWKIVKQEQPELDIYTLRDWSMRFTPDIRQEVEATAYHFWNMALNAIKEGSK